MKKKNNALTSMAPYIIIGLLIVFCLFVLGGEDTKVNEISTGELITAIKEEKIEEIVITPKSSESVYYVTGKLEGYKKNEEFTTKVIEEQMPFITETITEHVDTEDITYKTNKEAIEEMGYTEEEFKVSFPKVTNLDNVYSLKLKPNYLYKNNLDVTNTLIKENETWWMIIIIDDKNNVISYNKTLDTRYELTIES